MTDQPEHPFTDPAEILRGHLLADAANLHYHQHGHEKTFEECTRETCAAARRQLPSEAFITDPPDPDDKFAYAEVAEIVHVVWAALRAANLSPVAGGGRITACGGKWQIVVAPAEHQIASVGYESPEDLGDHRTPEELARDAADAGFN